MSASDKRAEQDAKTLYAMGHIYCTGNHPGAERDERGVCERCRKFVEYSLERAQQCPHGHKGNCNDCLTPCYEPKMRAGIRLVMRYSAPRMLYKHPVLSVHYLSKKIAGKISR